LIAEVGAGNEELVEREGLIEGASDESRLGEFFEALAETGLWVEADDPLSGKNRHDDLDPRPSEAVPVLRFLSGAAQGWYSEQAWNFSTRRLHNDHTGALIKNAGRQTIPQYNLATRRLSDLRITQRDRLFMRVDFNVPLTKSTAC